MQWQNATNKYSSPLHSPGTVPPTHLCKRLAVAEPETRITSTAFRGGSQSTGSLREGISENTECPPHAFTPLQGLYRVDRPPDQNNFNL